MKCQNENMTQKTVKIWSFFSHINKKIYVGLMRQLYSGIYSGIIYVLRDVIAPYSKEYIIF